VIAEAVGGTVKYAGAPSFAYEAGDERLAGSWLVDKDSVLYSPEIEFDQVKDIRPVIDALNIAGLTAEGMITLKFPACDFNEASLIILENLRALRNQGSTGASVYDERGILII